MTNQDLLNKLDAAHQTTSQAILQLRDLTEREQLYTSAAKATIQAEIHAKVTLAISEMEIIAQELAV